MFHANGNQKKDWVTILISDKINIKIKTVVKDKEGHYIMIDLPTEQNKPKYVRTKQQSFRTHKVKTDKPENINRQIHNYDCGLHNLSFNKRCDT